MNVTLYNNVRILIPKAVQGTICSRCLDRKFTISTYADFYEKGYKIKCKGCGQVHYHVIWSVFKWNI
jgi:RNase P subunit RPR2